MGGQTPLMASSGSRNTEWSTNPDRDSTTEPPPAPAPAPAPDPAIAPVPAAAAVEAAAVLPTAPGADAPAVSTRHSAVDDLATEAAAAAAAGTRMSRVAQQQRRRRRLTHAPCSVLRRQLCVALQQPSVHVRQLVDLVRAVPARRGERAREREKENRQWTVNDGIITGLWRQHQHQRRRQLWQQHRARTLRTDLAICE